MAVAKLAKHRGLSRIDAEEALEPRRDAALNIVQVDDDGGVCDEDDVPEERFFVERSASTNLIGRGGHGFYMPTCRDPSRKAARPRSARGFAQHASGGCPKLRDTE